MEKAFLFLFLISITQSLYATQFPLQSPDGKIKTLIKVEESISVAIEYMDDNILKLDHIALLLKEADSIGVDDEVFHINYEKRSMEYPCLIPTKHTTIREEFNALTLDLNQKFQLEFRVYNDGFAYRFISNSSAELIIEQESMILEPPEGTETYFPEESSLISHNERIYKRLHTNEIETDKFCSLPVLFNTKKGTRILFSESDLRDYPGLWLKKGKQNTFNSLFSEYPETIIPREGSEDRNELITQRSGFIAKTKGERTFPWRAFIIGSEKELVESTLIYQLASPSKLAETEWIKPGQVAWDWYNANNIYDIDFKSGINTKTYKYYIDFAAKYGIPYIILDEGWSQSTTNIKSSNEKIDIPELVQYGKDKDVRLILWTLWKPLSEDITGALTLYKNWGIAGIKVDFMQRSDQIMVNYYETVAREAAKHKLLVDFHGSYKPTGLNRTYPNVMTYEGVKGNENNKWSQLITPTHNLTIPFIRMAVGPMDYTPGAMVNKHLDNHLISFTRPEGLGTRAHEIAKYVIYESPLQMLCDSPSHYLKESTITEIITQIPVTWDETIFISGEITKFILIARRKGNDWYLAAMTNEEEREIEIGFPFLKNGKYEFQILQDGVNADSFAQDYKVIRKTIDKPKTMKIKMAKSGGWLAILKQTKQ